MRTMANRTTVKHGSAFWLLWSRLARQLGLGVAVFVLACVVLLGLALWPLWYDGEERP